MRHHEVEVMGTVVTFDLFDERGFHAEAAESVFADAANLLHHVDEVFSTWKPQSPVSRLRRGELDESQVPAELADVLELCRGAKEISHGWFDPWSLPGGVDPTGYVKGWAAQAALAVLERLGARGAIVTAAGAVAVSGRPSGPSSRFRGGIVNPFDTASLACVARVESAIATSGDYERGAHLIDPFSGQRTTRFASASVCGEDLGLADALATALVVGGADVLAIVENLEGYEALVVHDDHSWTMTGGFPLVSEVTL